MTTLRKCARSFCQAYRVPIAMFFMALALSLALPQMAIATGAWAVTGSLTTGRYCHTATLLYTGKVLVAGGWNGIDLDSAEIYDPIGMTWSTTGSLKTGRDSHTATPLNNGKVLVAGGSDTNGRALNSVEIYDPIGMTWSTTGSLTTGRYCHTATLLTDGKVLVAGGWNGSYVDSAEIYDPGAKTWSTTGSLKKVHYNHTATLLTDGKVLVAGGRDANANALNSVEIYDPIGMTWSTTGSLKTGRDSHTANLLTDGKVLVAGGLSLYGSIDLDSAEIYDPGAKTWSTTGSLKTGRSSHTATPLNNGKVLVAGGFNGNIGSIYFVGSAEIYDPGAKTWSTTGTLTTARFLHTATLLTDGKVLVAGGYGPSGYLSGAELYDSPVVLSVNPTSLSPSCQRGQNASPQTFEVWNSGGDFLYYTISDNATWLSVTPTSGISTGEQDSITVNYATSGLAAGTYTGAITVTALGVTGSPKIIGVTLAVKPQFNPSLLLLLLD